MGMEPFSIIIPWVDTIEETIEATQVELGESIEEMGSMDALYEDDEDAFHFMETVTDSIRPLSDKVLVQLFGSNQPSADDVDNSEAFEEYVEEFAAKSGLCRYFILYDDDDPVSALFFGWSKD